MRSVTWLSFRPTEAVLALVALLLPLWGSGCQCGGTGGQQDLSATLEATSPVVADGVRTSVVTITVVDGTGEPASAIELVLGTDRPADTVEQPASPTNAAGQATARVSSTEVGTSTLSLTTAAGDAIGGSGTIEFIAGTSCTPGASEVCYDGPAGTETEGLCQAGSRDCDGAGSWGPCNGQVLPLPSDDDCDGADSDCDGSTDEDVDVTSPASCGGCGVVCSFPNAAAICDPATRTCSRGSCDPDWWPAANPVDGCDYFCAGDPTADEVCNGLDEDCDGAFDEGFDADNDGYTSCGTVPGVGTDPALVDCEDLEADVNPAGVETCDGRDEDCDGNTDGGLTPPGLCLGLGECAGTTETCSGAGGWVCNYGATYLAVEDATACDGLDNDCDGLTDETCSCTPGDPPQPCSVDLGNCVSGVQDCQADGTWGACSGVLPAVETCDGTDESCDGTVDEGFDGDGDGYTACGTDPAGGTDPTRVDCDPARGDVYPGAPELCDGIDNDCDGSTDENGAATCDDGVFCNGAEVCGGAAGCQAGTAPTCDDGVACTTDACDGAADACTNTPMDVACDDGVFCNGLETCDAVLDCQAGPPPACDDGVGCTTDACDGATDACASTAVDAACDDGVFCNGAETCDAALDCQGGPPPTCDDGVGCTTDACDGGTDACLNTPVDTACDDGTFCNGAETCNAVTDCQAGAPPACDDGVACTIDSCDGASDACANSPDATACNDGNSCTLNVCDAALGCQFPDDDGATCSVGACNGTCGAGLCGGCSCNVPADCDDGVVCTVEDCVAGACVNTPSDAACDDGTFCNGAETCDAALDCQAGTPPTCDDGVGCTTDACDGGTDACGNTPVVAACDDGVFCNGAETCDAALDCQPGSPPACDDGVGCTTDACDVGTDACLNTPVAAACDDGTFCNGAETCDAALDCQPGSPPACDDGVGCTTDICDGGTDACLSTPVDASCDDGTFCNGVESCNAVLDCQAGTPPACDDGVFCTTDSCDGGTDTCANAPSDAACDDGTFCNGAETCDAALDCQTGTPPACNDGDACTTDSCSIITDLCDNPVRSVDGASTVTASSSCLTLGSGARAAVFVDLRDTLGVPLTGATLTPQVAGTAVTWSTALGESAALPGTYYGVLEVPASGASSTVTIDYDACTQTGTLAGSVTLTYAAANSGVGGTAGCNGPDGNLRVQVLAAEDDSVIQDAHVMVGLTAGTPLITDPEVFLAGGAPDVTNLGLTDAQGYVVFHDLGTALDGPVTVTAGQPDASLVERAYFTYDRVSAADLVAPLSESEPAVTTVRLDTGTASGFTETGTTADLQGGLVLPQVALGEVTALDLDSLLEPNRCVTLPAGQGVLAMPENLWVPSQCMARVFGFCVATLAQHRWAATVPQNNRLNMLVGGLNATVAQNMCEWSELLQGFSLAGGSNSAIGFVPSTATGSSSSGTSVALANGAHTRTLTLTTSNRPPDTDIFAAVLGDHAGSDGLGPNYVNGFKFERYDGSPGSTSILFAANGTSNLPTAPDPATARYWAAAIATYFDPAPSRPAANAPPATADNGASTVLWRDDGAGNAPLDGSGNASWSVSDFLGIAKVAVNATNKTFTWDDVASARTPDLSVHTLYRETETYRAAPLSCASEKDVISATRATDWEVWRPHAVTCTGTTGNETVAGPKECFTLPTLPAGWPRAGSDAAGGKFDGMAQLAGGAEACSVPGDCGITGDACELFGGRCTSQTHKSCNGDGDCSGCQAGDTCGGSQQICVDTSTGNSRTARAFWSLRIDALGSAAAFDFNAFDLPERSASMTHESSNYFPLNR